MLKAVIFKLIGGAFIAISALSAVSVVVALFNGGAQSIKMLLLMPLHPATVIENPLGALSIAMQAGIQILIIWILYRLGRKMYSSADTPKEDKADSDADKKDIRL